MSTRRTIVPLMTCAALVLLMTACRAVEPLNRPVNICTDSCKARANRSCSEAECERGCEFILDRVIEKEADNVIACVARTPRRCNDVVWANCAAQVGPHADGGAPPPPPPAEDD